MSEEINTTLKYKRCYKIIKQIGQGGYSRIYKAFSYETNSSSPIIKDIINNTNNIVAIKRITTINESTDQGFELNTIRELTVLKNLIHENLLKCTDLFWYDSSMHLVLEYLPMNLNDLKSIPLSIINIKSIFYKICKGLYFLHSKHIMHRDIKPENILISINKSSEIDRVVLADFGLSRRLSNYKLTPNVFTRWYRPPELLMGCTFYNLNTDIFALGLLLSELIIKKPLFTGNTDIEQLNLYYSYLYNEDDVDFFSKLKGYMKYIKGKKFELKTLLYGSDESSLLLIEKCLLMNPLKRISIRDIMESEYFKVEEDLNSNIKIYQN